jgi:biotin transporter BioY
MSFINFYHQYVTVRAIPEFKTIAPCNAGAIVEAARKSKDLKPFQNWMIVGVALVYSIQFFLLQFFITSHSLLPSIVNVLLFVLFLCICTPCIQYVYLRTLRPQILLELNALKK